MTGLTIRATCASSSYVLVRQALCACRTWVLSRKLGYGSAASRKVIVFSTGPIALYHPVVADGARFASELRHVDHADHGRLSLDRHLQRARPLRWRTLRD